jgi:hypothetical protein
MGSAVLWASWKLTANFIMGPASPAFCLHKIQLQENNSCWTEEN